MLGVPGLDYIINIWMTLFVYVQEALLTVSARVPDTEQYRDFSDEVKRIAREEFNYTYDEDPVDPFVAAFHEAVLLYAIVSHPGSPAAGSYTSFYFRPHLHPLYIYDPILFLFGV